MASIPLDLRTQIEDLFYLQKWDDALKLCDQALTTPGITQQEKQTLNMMYVQILVRFVFTSWYTAQQC